ncbi:diphthine methyl ester synthase isoform 2-T2 [Synchiropus picturatus]
MLYFIGLGLGDAADITVKGLQAIKRCSRVYLEAYTSMLTVGKEALEEYYGKELILADRDLVEQGADEILKDADVTDVAFLVVGDPFGATTHSDLVLRAVQAGIPYRVIHNASIMNAVGCCGLQLYNFGETVSLVFWTETWRPESFYDKICKNRYQSEGAVGGELDEREEDLRAATLHDSPAGGGSADANRSEEAGGRGGAWNDRGHCLRGFGSTRCRRPGGSHRHTATAGVM